MDVSLSGVREDIQKFTSRLIDINDWVFYRVCDLIEGVNPADPLEVNIDHFLSCFGVEWDDLSKKPRPIFDVTPAKGPHACGMLRLPLEDPLQFKLGPLQQLYIPTNFEIWYRIQRGVDNNAVILDTFGRVALVTDAGRHHGARNIILDIHNIDFRLSDDEHDTFSIRILS
jgi:hypothetical protein